MPSVRIVCVFAIALLGATMLFSELRAAPPRPNIILILADDVGYSDLGCYGGEVKTPVLDGLAANGIRFTQFYNSTRCCPTRAGIHTGLYPHQAGIGGMDNRTERRGYEGYLTDRCVTMAQVLKTVGYRTYMVGKWHVNHNPGPIDRGFDEFYGLLRGHSASFFDPVANGVRLPAGRPTREYPSGQYYATDAFTDHALDFIAEGRKLDENGDRSPFFLFLAHTAPHFPLHAPKEEIDKYANTYHTGWDVMREARFARQKQMGLFGDSVQLTPRSIVPRNRFNAQTGWADRENPAWDTLDTDRRADLARRMAIFAAMIDRMDQNIGRIVDDLEKHGELDNTLIMFLSDNGACAEWDPWGFDINSGPQNVLHRGEELEKMGGPGTYHSTGSGWAHASNTPWRFFKHYIHEGGINTPMIAHWGNGIKRRGEFERSVGHIIDFMPTVVELAGATYPTEWNGRPILPMEGRSLVPAFTGKQNEPRTLFWEHEGNRGVREGDMKLVWMGVRAVWELYDLKTDPVEMNDLAEKQLETVQRMATAWNEWAIRAFVIDAPIDTTPGLVFDLDLSQRRLRDLSEHGNPIRVVGELPVVQNGRQFNRQGYIEVPNSESLNCANTPWTVEVTIAPNSAGTAENGIILARGGNQNGYSLALQDGKPVFTIVLSGDRYTVQGTEKISGHTTLTGKINARLRASLEVGDKEVDFRLFPELMRLPGESMQIGSDQGSQVNDPSLPDFLGVIERVRIYRGVPLR